MNDARNLVAQRVERKSLVIGTDQERFYAVTAMDRYGNESEAVQSYQNAVPNTKNNLKHDGKTLRLPKNGNILDADYITIETVQGNVVATSPCKNGSANIADIRNGIYIVRSLNKKGQTHRLGYFIVRR